MMEQEIWKEIKEFNKYEISNFGIIRNKETKNFKKQSLKENGYVRLYFYKNGITYMRYVHRLVAEAFIPNLENKPTVNHIDGNKTNNRVDNLEWATYKEQSIHALKKGLRKVGKEHPLYGKKLSKERCDKLKKRRKENSYIFNKKINQYDLQGNYIKTWDCINDAIRYYNNKAIEFCCRGKRKSASGFQWEYYKGDTNNIDCIEQNKNERHILQYDLEGNFIKEYSKIKDICKEYQIFSSNISICCKKNINCDLKNCNKIKGYIWKYKEVRTNNNSEFVVSDVILGGEI